MRPLFGSGHGRPSPQAGMGKGSTKKNWLLVRVGYCPVGQAIGEAIGLAKFRVGDRTTFADLKVTSSQFFSVSPDRCNLVDQHNAQWPLSHMVDKELRGHSGAVIRIVHMDDETIKRTELERRADGDAAAITDLLKMLGDEQGEKQEQPEGDADDAMSVSSAWSGDFGAQPELSRGSRRAAYVEMFIHSVFFALVMLIAFSRRDTLGANKLVTAFEVGFVQRDFGARGDDSFLTIYKTEDIWTWLEETFAEAVFDSDVDSSGSILSYNRLVGSIRLRQLRVSTDACSLPDSIKNASGEPFVPACWAPYSSTRRSEATYGPALTDPDSTAARGFSFSDSSIYPHEKPVISGASATYDASGFVRDIGPTDGTLRRDNYTDAVALLKDGGWIDLQTRAVIASLVAYNRNTDLIFTGYFLFERNAGGRVHSSYSFRTMPLVHPWGELTDWETLQNRPYFWLDIPLVLYWAGYVCYDAYAFREARRMKRGRWLAGLRKFMGGWRLLHIVTLVALAAAFAMRVVLYLHDVIAEWEGNPSGAYLELMPLAETWAAMAMAEAVVLLFSCVRFLKFFSYSRNTQLQVLGLTLSRSGYKFVWTTVLVAIFIVAMVILGQQTFGFDMDKFSTGGGSSLTLLLMLIGDVDPTYREMTDSDRVSAILYFAVFVTLFLFVLTSLFLAVVSDSYAITSTAHQLAEQATTERRRNAEAAAKETEAEREKKVV